MDLILLIAGSFLAALVSGAAGFGGSLLLLPVASAILGVEKAIPVLTIAQLMGNISRVASGFSQIDWKSVALFSVTAVPLASLGAFGFSVLDKDIVTRVVGIAFVILVLVKLLKGKDLPKGKGTMLIGGALAGGPSGLCGCGGDLSVRPFSSPWTFRL